MALRLADHWVWDFWFADDGETYHMYFLRASRALLDPNRRHYRASVGHACSEDLTTWTLRADALVPAAAPAFDDLATWTGSVVWGGDRWFMFYTGVSRAEKGLVQRVGAATSEDLEVWHRVGDGPLSQADPRWYEKLDPASWREEAWRDPWVFADPGGDGWHMLVTARANTGPAGSRGVLAHLRSWDLVDWQPGPPIAAGTRFGHLEVPQVATIDGTFVLLFSCMPADVAAAYRDRTRHGGVWSVAGSSLVGPFDVDKGVRLFDHSSLYSGRLIQNRQGQWMMLGFLDNDPERGFVGEICDPIPVSFDGQAGLVRSPDRSRLS